MGSTHHKPSHEANKPHDDATSNKEAKSAPETESNMPSKGECPECQCEPQEGVKSPQPELKREPKVVTITDQELDFIKQEVVEYKDKYLRTLAESENSRKRLQKEKQELIQYALQNVIVDFLNPIDHMENALKCTEQMSGEVKNWAIGFQMILTQFKDVLTENGVIAFPSEGKPFDPHFQEAIETIVTEDVPPGTVVEESLKGYKMGERVIRPARVKVAKAPVKPSEENGTNESETIEESKK